MDDHDSTVPPSTSHDSRVSSYQSLSDAMEIGVQTSCSIQVAQWYALEVQTGTLQHKDGFLEDLNTIKPEFSLVDAEVQTSCSLDELLINAETFLEDADIIEPDLNVVEIGVQTSCSLEELLIHAETQRDALEVQRDTLEEANAYLEDRLLFMEAQLNLLLHVDSFTEIVPNKGSFIVVQSNQKQDDIWGCDPFLLRAAQDTTSSPSMSKATTVESLSAISERHQRYTSDTCARLTSDLVTSTWSSLRTTAQSLVGLHVDTVKSRLERLQIARGSFRRPPGSNRHDELHELSTMSCLWFSLKSNDEVVGYASGTSTIEPYGIGRINESTCSEFPECITSNVRTRWGPAPTIRCEYDTLRRHLVLRSRHQDILSMMREGRQRHQDILSMMGEGRQRARASPAGIIVKFAQGVPSFRMERRNICARFADGNSHSRLQEADRMQPALCTIASSAHQSPPESRNPSNQSSTYTTSSGLGDLLPVQSLSKATRIWGRSPTQSDTRE